MVLSWKPSFKRNKKSRSDVINDVIKVNIENSSQVASLVFVFRNTTPIERVYRTLIILIFYSENINYKNCHLQKEILKIWTIIVIQTDNTKQHA